MAVPPSREGTVKVIISKDNLYKLERAQRHNMETGIYGENADLLTDLLGGFVTALGFICATAATPVGVALGVVSVAVDMAPSAKNLLESLSNSGRNWILSQYDYMYDHPQYDLIEITYPYLEYYNIGGTSKTIRFCTGKGILNRVHGGSGWISAS